MTAGRARRSSLGSTARWLAAVLVLALVAAACAGEGADGDDDAEAVEESGEDTASDDSEGGEADDDGSEEDAGSAEVPEWDTRYDFTVGWTETLANAGQVTQALQRTNVFDLWGIDAEYVTFTASPEMAQALLGGEIDNHWGSEQPLTGAIARGADMTFTAAHVGWRTGFVVKEDSGIESLEDLRGGTVGMHMGISTQYAWELALEDAGLEIGTDVEVVNVPVTEHEVAFEHGEVDSIVSWDPAMTVFEAEGAEVIHYEVMGAGLPVPGTIMSFQTEMVEEERDKAVRFLAALIEATWYAIQNQDQTNEWFAEASGLPMYTLERTVEYEALWAAESIEDIDIRLTDEQIARMQAHADWFLDQGQLDAPVEVAEHVDTSVAEEAMELVARYASDRELELLDP